MQPPSVLDSVPDHCLDCSAYYPIGDDSPALTGFCLRYPPRPLFGSHVSQPGPGVPQAESIFPVVQAGWWCKEFSAK